MFNEKNKAIFLLLEDNLIFDKRFSVTICKYYKYLGLDKETAFTLLTSNYKQQNNDILQDLRKIIENVYSKNYTFIHEVKVEFFSEEINFIKYNLRSKGDIKVALFLLYLSKVFGNGFYCYNMKIHNYTGLSIRHIKRISKRIESAQFVKIIRNNDANYYQNNFIIKKRYSKPNVYIINEKIFGKGHVIFSYGDINHINDLKNCLQEVMKK